MSTTQSSTFTQEEVEHLARAHRNGEIIKGGIHSVGFMNLPVEQNDGSMKLQETEVAIFRLEGNIKAYCPKESFRDHDFKSLNGFVGTVHDVVVERLDLENQVALVSVKKADSIKSDSFWEQIQYLEKKDELQDQTFEGVIQGVNPKTQKVHVRVSGQDCFMNKDDWHWNRRVNVFEEAERGEKINVKVVRFNVEEGLVQVSRKDTLPNPFHSLENMKQQDLVAGRVSAVHPINGIFVNVEGVDLKGIKPRQLEEPEVGEIVSCRIRDIDAENRKGKVVIVSYPRGKKKKKDVGSFLFEE